MSNDNSVKIDENGQITAVGDDAKRRLGEIAGDYGLMVDTHEIIILQRKRENAPQIRLAGEVLSRMTMMEIINIIATADWRGDIWVYDSSDKCERILSFDQGALKGATSNASSDRLGEVLYRRGLLTKKQIEDISTEVTKDKRFGQLCVDKGLLDATQLFDGMRKQAEDIFFATLLVDNGHFTFAATDDADTSDATTMHIPMQHLLMEGVQRIDEMAHFRGAVPSSAACPEAKPDVQLDKKIDEIARMVFEECNGQSSIADIARVTGLGEFSTTKAVYHLLQRKHIILRSGPKADPETIIRLVKQFNEIVQDIMMAMATYGRLERTKNTLEKWVEDSSHANLFGAGLDDFGSLDPTLTVQALQSSNEAHPLEAFHQALHELAAFALFTAGNSLPRNQELSLARDVKARLKHLRL